jgi:hypothetical protein
MVPGRGRFDRQPQKGHTIHHFRQQTRSAFHDLSGPDVLVACGSDLDAVRSYNGKLGKFTQLHHGHKQAANVFQCCRMQKSVTITSRAELRFNIGAKFLSLRDSGDINFCLPYPISQALVGRVQHGLKGIGEPTIHLRLDSL